MSYLPPDQAEVGDAARRRVPRRAVPGHRRGRRRDAAVRPGERPDPFVNDPRLRQARARDRRADRPDRRRAGHRHALPGLHDQPPRGVRRRGGGPDRRGAGRVVDRADARAGGREEQLRDAMAIGIDRAVLLETDGCDWDAVATAGAIAETIRGLEAAGGAFDLILFGNEAADTGDFQVGVRVATALGRPVVSGIKGITAGDGRVRGAARGARRRLGGVRAAAAGGARREGGPEPAALPVGARAAAGKKKEIRTVDAVAAARRPDEAAARACPEGTREPGRGDRAGRGGGARGRRAARSGSGCWDDDVLVLVEHAEARPDRLSLEALSLGRVPGGSRCDAAAHRAVVDRVGGRAGRPRRRRRPTSSTTRVLPTSRRRRGRASLAQLAAARSASPSSPPAATAATRSWPTSAPGSTCRWRRTSSRSSAADPLAPRPPALGRQPPRGRRARRADEAAHDRARTQSRSSEAVAGAAPRSRRSRPSSPTRTCAVAGRPPPRAGPVGRLARRRQGRRRRRPRRRQPRRLQRARGAGRPARRGGRRLARRDEPGLAAALEADRPDGPADRAGPVHRLRDQRRDPAHRRLQGREADPRDQHRPRLADHGRRRLRGDRRSPPGRAGDQRRGSADHRSLTGYPDSCYLCVPRLDGRRS